MLRDELRKLVVAAVAHLVETGAFPPYALELPIEIGDTKSADHGDFACNYALAASKRLGMPPRSIGELLAQVLSSSEVFEAVQVAGPGFVNLRLKPSWVASFVAPVLEQGTAYAQLTPENPLSINVEFVSVNPNGPITVGSGRGAAFGSTLCNVLAAAGHTVHREYYINDGVNSEQMRQFALSVRALALGEELPEKAYRGEYVADVARALGSELVDDVAWWQAKSQDLMIERQRTDLATFGVFFDTWFSEQSLHDEGIVLQRLEALIDKGAADENPVRTKLKLGKNGKIEAVDKETQATDTDEEDVNGLAEEGEVIAPTLWLRSTKFGDDMDRVLRRKDGRLTYISSDIAYHADKFNRPPTADKLITVLGPDHHGYIGRLHAVLAALLVEPVASATSDGLSEIDAQLFVSVDEREACRLALEEARRKLEVVIFQIVRFVKDGKPAPMRKRDGNIYELRDLIHEIGKNVAPQADLEEQRRIGADVSRFFYLMRSHDTHMDFDIDLATKGNDENPVFYAQYAHARIASVIRKAAESGFVAGEGVELALLEHPRETALIKKILDLPLEVGRCADDFGVHRLTTYAVELARSFHHFYDGCRVLQVDQPELTRARLALCTATKVALRATFELLGVSAPEKMERGTTNDEPSASVSDQPTPDS